MSGFDHDAALDRLREFAKQQRSAGKLSDQGSLDRAADLVALYEERTEGGRRRWAMEIEPPKTRVSGGRPVDPESFNRFTKWLREKANVDLGGAHLYRLRTAHELASSFAAGERTPAGEWVLRPLGWLRKNGHDDAVPVVWERACKLAGDQAPDQATVRKALTEWKHERGLTGTRTAGAASRKRTGPEAEAEELKRLAYHLRDVAFEQFVMAINEIEADTERWVADRRAA